MKFPKNELNAEQSAKIGKMERRQELKYLNGFREFLKTKPIPKLKNSEEKTVILKNEYFEAEAHWKLKDGIWVCTQADPKISWMLKMTREQAKLECLRMGFNWEWK